MCSFDVVDLQLCGHIVALASVNVLFRKKAIYLHKLSSKLTTRNSTFGGIDHISTYVTEGLVGSPLKMR